MRKTKIITTIGPACMDYKTMKGLVEHGANIFRVNLSHAKQPDMDIIVKQVKQIRKELNVPLPIMIDTRGPEIRVKSFRTGSVQIKRGQLFIFSGRDIIGNENIVSFNIPAIVKALKPGNKILACNGLLTFKIIEIKGKDVITRAQNSGTLSNYKSLFLPGVKYNTAYLNDADKADILWGIKNDVDFVAASFVNSAKDVEDLREYITSNGGKMKIISKIESAFGVKNMDEIIEVSDAIMVARGDLGVELPVERLPDIQKNMINKCIACNKPVITATEMLESMITNQRPTRAEVSDVANAVYDGTSAVMLSGESAMGKYPLEAVKTMANTCKETEKHIDYHKQFVLSNRKLSNTTTVVAHSAVNASFYNNKCIVVFSSTGFSAGIISNFRPSVDIVAITPNAKVYRQLELNFGITPVMCKTYTSTDAMFEMANSIVKQHGFAKKGDNIVITCGVPKQNGRTNLIKINEIK